MNDQRNAQIIEDIKNRTLGLDDEFQFGCRACGKCCRYIDIMLSAYDLYNLAGCLNSTIDEILQRYCEVGLGAESGLPIVYLQFKNGVCPFLIGKRCRVHKSKPSACALYPLGRAYLVDENKVIYFKQTIKCGEKYGKHTVREWISKNRNKEEFEEAYRIWTSMLNTICPIIEKIPESVHADFISVLYARLYKDYDIHKPFLAQLQERSLELNKLANGLLNIWESYS